MILKRSLISIFKNDIIEYKDFINKSKNINTLKVEAIVYYKLIRDKNNKLFSLIINKNNIVSSTQRSSYGSRILVKKLYLYESKRKYKKYYKSNISINSNNSIRINSAKSLIYKKILAKLFSKYYNFINIFNKTKADKLLSYRIYDYKLEFIEDYNKIDLSKSRIYLIFDYKLK